MLHFRHDRDSFATLANYITLENKKPRCVFAQMGITLIFTNHCDPIEPPKNLFEKVEQYLSTVSPLEVN